MTKSIGSFQKNRGNTSSVGEKHNLLSRKLWDQGRRCRKQETILHSKKAAVTDRSGGKTKTKTRMFSEEEEREQE